MSESATVTGKRLAEASRDKLMTLCADLVAARSEQPTGDTTAAAAVVAAFLTERGLAPQLVAATPTKPNLVCTIEGKASGPHLVLNGHLDTLNPGSEADWSVPVWNMQRKAGRLTGLGIGNMKAGSAALAVAFAALGEMRDAFAGRITLTLVADEVVFGPDGAGFLIERDPSLLGDFVINGEGPGNQNLATA
jgi:succinyl-diaminopimelate desuccinylase